MWWEIDWSSKKFHLKHTFFIVCLGGKFCFTIRLGKLNFWDLLLEVKPFTSWNIIPSLQSIQVSHLHGLVSVCFDDMKICADLDRNGNADWETKRLTKIDLSIHEFVLFKHYFIPKRVGHIQPWYKWNAWQCNCESDTARLAIIFQVKWNWLVRICWGFYPINGYSPVIQKNTI